MRLYKFQERELFLDFTKAAANSQYDYFSNTNGRESRRPSGREFIVAKTQLQIPK